MRIKEISKDDDKSIRECRLLCQENYLENLVVLGDLYAPCFKLSQVYAVYNAFEKIVACFTIFNGFKDLSVVLPYDLPKKTFTMIMGFLQESLPDSFGFVSFDISEKKLAEFFQLEEQTLEYCMVIEDFSASINSQDLHTVIKKATPDDYSKINDFYKSINAYAWHPIQLESGFYFFIEESEEIVACGGTHLETPTLAQLGNIYVLEKHRRKGYGAIITSHITREILHSKKVASLFVLKDNLPAILLYQSIGFEIYKPVSIFSLTNFRNC
jgi:ribosomal protein S18 acetylase RimI-like enzyme